MPTVPPVLVERLVAPFRHGTDGPLVERQGPESTGSWTFCGDDPTIAIDLDVLIANPEAQ